jgi:oxygen-dependent protoporphyrinogen oxidase
MKTRVAIIGGGITGLAAAAWLEHDHGIGDRLVIEAGDRPGGKIQSEIDDGFTLEWGPQGFLDNSPDTLELAGIAGLTGELVRADESAAARYILRAGKLREVVANPLGFMLSDVLPLGARLRVLGEPFAASKPDHDETVFDFAARRIGSGAAKVLVDAMVTGVFAGDSRALSLAATFPRMAAMEAEHGSLVRALIAKKRAARRAGASSGGPAGPAGTLTTFREGMAQLPQALASMAGSHLLLERKAENIERSSSGFVLDTHSGPVEAEAILVSMSAPRAAALLAPLAPAAVAPLEQIATSPIAVVMLGYLDANAFQRPVRGFGFLVPGGEDQILGTLYCHDIFPGQAPEGSLLLRVMVGGTRSPAMVDLPNDDLLLAVRASLARILGRDPEPDRRWIVRWPRGISQYTVGHLDRVAAAEDAVRAAGLEIAGSSYRGVSVNDCIKQARKAAARLADRLQST